MGRPRKRPGEELTWLQAAIEEAEPRGGASNSTELAGASFQESAFCSCRCGIQPPHEGYSVAIRDKANFLIGLQTTKY
jgi:hypothetical protein